MRWLWTLISRWWRSGKLLPPGQIEYRAFSRFTPVTKVGLPVGVRGLHLIVQSRDTTELVSAGAALDRAAFWRAWMYFGGQVHGWVDEDGNEVDLTA